MKILLIEDDQETIDYLAKGLAEHGHVIDRARDGRNGLFLAGGETYDLMIVDRMLPGLDGLAIVKTIRGGTPEEKLAAATDMFAANPTFAKTALEDMKKAGEVSVQMEELSMKMQLHGAQLQALNLKNARANPSGVLLRTRARFSDGGRRCILLPSVGSTAMSRPTNNGIGGVNLPHRHVRLV